MDLLQLDEVVRKHCNNNDIEGYYELDRVMLTIETRGDPNLDYVDGISIHLSPASFSAFLYPVQ